MLDIPTCRDGAMFRHILNFMRTGRPMLPDTFDQWDLLLEEARYYELTGESLEYRLYGVIQVSSSHISRTSAAAFCL